MSDIGLQLYISKRFNQNTDGEEDISDLIINLFNREDREKQRLISERDMLQTALVDLLKVISEDNLIVGGRAYLDAARRVVKNIASVPLTNYVFATGDSDALNLNTNGRRYKLCPSCEPVDIPMELVIGCPKCDYDEVDDSLVNHCNDCCVALMTHVYQEFCLTHEMV